MKAKEIIKELPKGLLAWYTFVEHSKVLYVADIKDSLYEFLIEQSMKVIIKEKNKSIQEAFVEENLEVFDYIIVIYQLEKMNNPVHALSQWKKMLTPEGKFLLGVDNRLGIKYFCGDRDSFTNRSFDGIENYRQILQYGQNSIVGRNYSKAEMDGFLKRAGWKEYKRYSVLPNLNMPQLIYSEEVIPNEELGIRLAAKYYHPDSVFLEERFLYTDLIANGLFHGMANAFFIECSKAYSFENVNHVTLSLDRGREKALATIIRNTGMVEKRALYQEGRGGLIQLKKNERDLAQHGIAVVEGALTDSSYIMNYINQPLAINYLRELIYENKEEFVREIDRFRKLILQSSDHVSVSEDQGIILEKGFIDLVPLNCFYINGEYVFFDQEFYADNYPANVIIFRTIEIIYMHDAKIESILPKSFFWKRYDLEKKLDVWRKASGEFTQKLRNQKQLQPLIEKYEANYQTIHTNRQRINYSKEEYQKIFGDIFKNIQNKKIILFGAGNFSKRFLSLYGKDYEIGFVVDNNPNQWGKQLEGHEIFGPEKLQKIDLDKYRIIICVKAFLPIVHQLKSLGIESYYVYDRNIEYGQNILPTQVVQPVDEKKQKKYNIGYIAGVFDLFHIGHLNLLKRAKEQCNYLIVGVVSDEGVKRNKKVEPYIPFEERIEIVGACSYVDKAVEIPLNFAGSREAYEKYKFDCQFSGSDYQNDPSWEANKIFLEKKGADLVFLSYTQQTSSTKIKKAIQQSINKE